MAKKQRQVLVEWPDPTAKGGLDSKATITEAGIKVASKMARAGHPMRGIAASMGLGVASFEGAVERQPDLKLAMNTSLGDLEQECVGHLVAAMRAGSFVPAMFILKAKFLWRESGPIDGGADTRVAINLSIPPGMSREEAAKLIHDISPETKPEVLDVEFEEVRPPAGITRG